MRQFGPLRRIHLFNERRSLVRARPCAHEIARERAGIAGIESRT